MNLLKYFTFRSNYFLVTWYVLALVLCFLVIYFFGWKLAGVTGLIGLVYPGYFMTQAIFVQKQMKNSGHDWIMYFGAVKICAQLLSKAWHIPSRDMAATIPEYEDNTDGVVRIVLKGHDLYNEDHFIPFQAPCEKTFDYIEKHGNYPTAPPVNDFVIAMTNWVGIILMYILFGGLLFLFNSLTDWQMAWSFSFMALGVIYPLTIVPQIMRKRLRALGYESIKINHLLNAQNVLGKYIWKIPPRKKMEEILDTNEFKFEEVIRSTYTAKMYAQEKSRREN